MKKGLDMFRGYIFIAVFLSGAALMSLEMAGFRLVQPEFGSDIVVYGSLISVFLVGLSLGAFFGGKLADRKPDVFFLGGVLFIAGLAVVFMPLYSDGVFQAFNPIEEGMGLAALEMQTDSSGNLVIYEPPDMRWTTLSVGMVLFFIPSLLMGMVSPYSARLLIHTMGKLGSGVGKISAISTLGSILGTLGSTFYLIQVLGTRMLIVSNGILLLVLGLGAFSLKLLPKKSLSSTAKV